jgi:integrase
MPRRKRESKWLVKEPNGVWYAYWSARIRGRTRTVRQSLGETDESKAEIKLARMRLDGTLDDFTKTHKSGKLTVSMVLADYWREHGSKCVSARTIKQRIARLEGGLGAFPVDELAIVDFDRYLDNRRKGVVTCAAKGHIGKTVGNGSLRNELAILAAAIRHAVKWKRLDALKAPTIVLPPSPAPKPLWLYKDELERLFAEGEGTRIGDFCRIAYYTGARRSSVEALTVFQVSLEKNRIRLDKPGAAVTSKRRPIVPIAKPLRSTIERCLSEAKAAGSTYLLGDVKPRIGQFDRLVRRAGLAMLPERDMRPAGKPTPHTLRHSRATHLLQAGVSPWAVAQLLGDRLETVTRVYGHACSDHLEQALEGMDELGS